MFVYRCRIGQSCINVKLGFVSPESFQVCLGLADELRLQSRGKEDKLEVKKMAVYALEKAMSCLNSEMKIRRKGWKVDKQTEKSKDTEGVDGRAISDSDQTIKPDNKQDMINVPDNTENNLDKNQATVNLSVPDKNQVTVNLPDNKQDMINVPDNTENNLDKTPGTGVLTNQPSLDSDGNPAPQHKPHSIMVTMDASDLMFEFLHSHILEPEFHDFNGDRDKKLFKPNQIWAIYGAKDGLPRFCAFIQKVISISPFEVRMAFLTPNYDSVYGCVNWVSYGLDKACGNFHLCQYETSTDINMFSHQVKWERMQNGVIKIFPQKGDIWALYHNWSLDWNESTPNETIYKYDLVEILDEHSEENGITVVPLVKVNGYNVVFRKDQDPSRVKQFPMTEIFRFCYQVPSYRLTDKDAGAKELIGCVELDPATTPLELLC